MKNLNQIAFAILLLILVIMSFFSSSTFFFYSVDKPWQLNPFVHEDSLSSHYKDNYKILGSERVLSTECDSAKSLVVVMVDAWGVPLDTNLMQEDFALFSNENVSFALHRRLANRNTHAEGTEFVNGYEHSTYFFGGDSTEYEGRKFVRKRSFKETVFCQNCDDEVMLAKLDSAIADTTIPQLRMLAWTTQTSRDGNRENLHKTLAEIANLIKKHPEMQFVIQGTHRPILGTPETRRMYHAHWVPVVVANSKKELN